MRQFGMTGGFVDPGSMSQPISVMQYTQNPTGVWSWQALQQTRANVTLKTERNIFSSLSASASGAEVILRKQALTLSNLLQWGDKSLYITSILPEGRLHYKVSTAVVPLATVTLVADATTQAMTFDGILAEKYARHEQEWPMSVNDLSLMLVVPKAITLRPGSLMQARGASWEVLVPHELDEFKNEYEIGRRVEL